MDYYNGPWSAGLTIPFISVTGDGSVVPGPGGPITSGTSGTFGASSMWGSGGTTTVTESGLGDISARIGYAFFPKDGSFYELSARIKFGTADADRALGTGEDDYYFQFDGIVGGGDVAPYVTLGYVITGDSATITYEDVPYGSLGLMFRAKDRQSSFGVGYDYRQATIAGTDDLEQISAFVNWNTSASARIGLSAFAGLTDSTPDFGASLNVTRSY